MNLRKVLLFSALLAGLTGPACQRQTPHASAPQVVRLFDLFRPEDLTGKVSLEDAGWKPSEWAAADMAAASPPAPAEGTNAPAVPAQSAAVAYRPLNDLRDVRVEQGKLVGQITGPAPVLDFSLKDLRGGAESVKVIEVRMTVKGAKQVWLRAETNGLADEQALASWAAQAEKWSPAADVTEDQLQSYRFELPSERGRGDTAWSRAALRRFALTFREGASGRFAIESVRLLTEREEKLKESSGQQWAGLAEIYRTTLAAKTPEVIRLPLRELPERARLDLAIGTKEDAPVKFKIAVAIREGAKDSTPTVVFERTVTTPDRWQTARIDLAQYARKSVTLELSLAGEKKGLWGYWGSPVIRSTPGPGATVAKTANGNAKPRGVIFLVIDTLRKDHLNIYGYPRETLIHLKKFAEEGVAFSQAISQGTMTKISVPSMVTSLYPLTHTVLGFERGLPASAKTLAEVFHDQGYATVAYSSVPFTGKMNNMHQGYDELHEAASIQDTEYRAKTSRHYVDRLIPWLADHRDVPFFAFLHVFDPHSPFRPRPPYDTLWGAPGSKERLAKLEADMKAHKIQTSLDNLPPREEYLKTGNDPEELLKIYIDWYDGSIRGVDAEIGRLLEALRELNLDDDTLIVWTTDHGEEFWEHGRLFHGHSVYGELNQVPLVFRWPNGPDVRQGVMIDRLVQNLDIMPTILELAGIQGPKEMQGRSLVPLLNGSGLATWKDEPALTHAIVSNKIDPRPSSMGGSSEPSVESPHFGVIDQGWKLVRKEVAPEAQQELYQHPADSLNRTNLVQTEGVASRSKALLDLLEAWKTRASGAQLPNDDTLAQQVSSEELRRLRALGYVGGATPARPPDMPAANTNAANQPSTGITNSMGHGRP